MKYEIKIINDAVEIFKDNKKILGGIYLTIPFGRSYNYQMDYLPTAIEQTENKFSVILCRKEPRSWQAETNNVKLIFSIRNNSLSVKAEIESNLLAEAYNYTFAPENSVIMHYSLPENHGTIMNLSGTNPYFLVQRFLESEKDILTLSQSISYETDGIHTNIMPISATDVVSHLREDTVVINTYMPHISKIESEFLLISASEISPYDAIKNNFTDNYSLFPAKLRSEKVYPEKFENFGWCTWNAFYRDVTEEGILSKMEEFKRKNIQVDWLIIDDGWSIYDDKRRLLSFKEDLTKFPNGLKHLVEKLKKDYGVKYVGVWHALTGYWFGISKDSEIFKEDFDKLYIPEYGGYALPGETYEKAFAFWDKWHSYLASCGIDFVKTDNQAAICPKYDYTIGPVNGIQTQLKAFEASVKKNFGGTVINCMGNNNELNFNRIETAVNRNSDDFYPERPEIFPNHFTRNIYCGTIHSMLNYCDFDMFWTTGEIKEQSAVLRSLSGGPVYVSDKVGETEKEVLEKVMLPDGTIPRFDDCLLPTLDCFYKDAMKSDIQKCFNKSGNNFVLLGMNLVKDTVQNGEFSYNDIPDLHGEYLAHDFKKNKYFIFNENTKYAFSGKYLEYALISLYPIENGKAKIGNSSIYGGAAGKLTDVDINTLI